MSKRYIIGLDPSGSYDNGKGTSGWCVFDALHDSIVEAGAIYAEDYPSAVEFWKAHTSMIRTLVNQYVQIKCIVYEKYLLYASAARSQINSEFETSQLIGIIKYWCDIHKLPIIGQTAAQIKKRWAVEVLVYKGYVTKKGKVIFAPNGQRLNEHELDAIKHAIHYSYFGGEDDDGSGEDT